LRVIAGIGNPIFTTEARRHGEKPKVKWDCYAVKGLSLDSRGSRSFAAKILIRDHPRQSAVNHAERAKIYLAAAFPPRKPESPSQFPKNQ
jgi:hypothetical protein